MDELNFTSDSIKLLDSLHIPFRIIQDNRIIHSNEISSEIEDSDITSLTDKSCLQWDEESIEYIRINHSRLRIDIKRKSSSEHMMLRINLNGNSSHLVVSNPDCRELSFKNYVKYINAGKNFENIIVVDDDPLVMEIYKYILDFLGYKTVLFSNPLLALETMKSADFDLLISDYNMPELNGFDFVKCLMEVKPMTPVVICSGLMDIYSDLFRYFGNDHHISLMTKPVTITKISNRLEVVEFITRLCSFCRENMKL